MGFMKKVLFISAFVLMHLQFQAGVIVIEGSYQGKNLFIQNPFAGSGVGFCVTEVTVNEQLTTDEIQSSSFEIDFEPFRFNLGDKVVVRIKYKDDCKPRVMNSEDLKSTSTFEVTTIKVDENGLKWSTTGESGPVPYHIEEYRWGRWIKVGEVQGKGLAAKTDYTFKIKLHSGIHKFRVGQTVEGSKPRYSLSAEFKSNLPEVSFYPIKVTKDINFSAETQFEVYDEYGTMVKSGQGTSVDVGALAKGIYYLNFDSKTDKFIKK
jgi:hypothetical protein